MGSILTWGLYNLFNISTVFKETRFLIEKGVIFLLLVTTVTEGVKFMFTSQNQNTPFYDISYQFIKYIYQRISYSQCRLHIHPKPVANTLLLINM